MTITMIYDPLILQVQEFVFMVGNERCNARTLRKVSRRSERPADANHASGVTDLVWRIWHKCQKKEAKRPHRLLSCLSEHMLTGRIIYLTISRFVFCEAWSPNWRCWTSCPCCIRRRHWSATSWRANPPTVIGRQSGLAWLVSWWKQFYVFFSVLKCALARIVSYCYDVGN